jgi:hypothetical protein
MTHRRTAPIDLVASAFLDGVLAQFLYVAAQAGIFSFFYQLHDVAGAAGARVVAGARCFEYRFLQRLD